MKKTQFNDSVTLQDVTNHKDGYKIVRGRIARTGSQMYFASELGADPMLFDESNRFINGMGVLDANVYIYRPDDEVFADGAVNGWAHVPVTLDHPPELVTPDNVTKYSIGEVGNKARLDRDGGWIDLEWIVKDTAAIAALDSTHKQVSGGYTADIDFTAGVAPDGRKYDGVQRSIDPNHLALVPRGRAFSDAAKPANWGATPQPQKDHVMTMKTIVVGDKAVQIAADVADIVTKMIADHKAEIDQRDAALGDAIGQVTNLKAQILGDEDKAALVKDGIATAVRAAQFIDGYQYDGASVIDIKRRVLETIYSADEVADFPDVAVDSLFKVVKPANVSDKARDAIKDAAKSKGGMNDPWAKAQEKLKGKN